MSATTGVAGWLNSLDTAARDWLNRTAGQLPGLSTLPGPAPGQTPGVTALPGAPGSSTSSMGGTAPPAAAPEEAPAAAPAEPGAPPARPSTLDEWRSQQDAVRAAITAAERAIAGGNADLAYAAQQALPGLRSSLVAITAQIGAEENRQRDEATAKTKADEAAAERKTKEAEAKAERDRVAAQQPKNGDTRTSRVEHNGVTAVITERYANGQWSYVQGSAQADTGLLGQPSERTAVDLDTARVNLRIAENNLAKATSPEAQQEAQLKLEQARVALQQAQQTLNKPTESTQDGYLVRVAPGGELSRVDLLTPEQRRQKDEDDARKRETEARGTLPTNAYAALTQETQRLQGRAQDKLNELTARQQRGELSAEQASNQFKTWFQGNVLSPLEGLRASAAEAQRVEQAQVEERNRLEDIRVQQANQQREQVGYQAGESARSALIGTFPSARSPEFAQQYGANVAAMSQRAQGRTAEERMAAPRSPGYTPQALDAARIQAVMPSPDAIAAAARQRALAAIAPTVAVRAGFTAPTLPTAPDIQGLLGSLPYRGPLSGPPAPSTGLLPTPGREAVDLGSGYARTFYGPNGEVYGPDWRITP